MVASIDEVASENDYNYESSRRRGWMESFGEVSCSFRIQVGTEASAYDAGENVNQNSGDIIVSAKSALMSLCTKRKVVLIHTRLQPGDRESRE